MKPRPIGLIGLGLVGSALAARLQQAGFCVVGFDVAPARQRAHKRLGGQTAGSAAEVFATCQRVLLSLPNSAVVETVLHEAAPQLRRGLRIIDTTTGEPDATARLGARLARRGVRYLDATIVGSSAQVCAGDVLVLAGGKKADFDAARDVFAAFAKQSFHTGPCGSGARMKLVVNLVLGLNRAVLAEGLTFAKHLGVSQKDALNVLKAGLAYSRIMDTKGDKMISGDFTPVARLSQHLKDVRLMLAAAARTGQRLPLSETHRELLERAEQLGLGALDNSAVIRAIEAGPTRKKSPTNPRRRSSEPKPSSRT